MNYSAQDDIKVLYPTLSVEECQLLVDTLPVEVLDKLLAEAMDLNRMIEALQLL